MHPINLHAYCEPIAYLKVGGGEEEISLTSQPSIGVSHQSHPHRRCRSRRRDHNRATH